MKKLQNSKTFFLKCNNNNNNSIYKCKIAQKLSNNCNILIIHYFCLILLFVSRFELVLCSSNSSLTSTSVVGLVYNSSDVIQAQLYKSAWIGFRDTINDNLPEQESGPNIIDVAHLNHNNVNELVVDWLLGNNTVSIVSLLDTNVLESLLQSYVIKVSSESGPILESNRVLHVVLSRSCLKSQHSIASSTHLHIECLKMNDDSIGTALLHRASKRRLSSLIPILDHDLNQLELLDVYKNVVKSFNTNNNANIKGLQLQTPIFKLHGLQKRLDKCNNKYNNNSNSDVGILILTKNARKLEQVYKYALHIFSPWGIEKFSLNNNYNNELGRQGQIFGGSIYTVEQIGGLGWDNPTRRRILLELNEFMGPNPLILTAVLTYDASARVVAIQQQQQQQHQPVNSGQPIHLPLSGSYERNPHDGSRATGVFFGLTPKPPNNGMLLQPSNYILEDMITISTTSSSHSSIIDYQVATSSLLHKQELLDIATLAKLKYDCSNYGLKVTTHDPFNQLSYNYDFTPSSLPEYLLIPNQGGYGLELSCITQDGMDHTSTNILIACSPTNGRSLAEPVHCFRSNPHTKTKRSTQPNNANINRRQVRHYSHPQQQPQQQQTQPIHYPRSYYYGINKNNANAAANNNFMARDDNANNLYYAPPPTMSNGYYEAPPATTTAAPPAPYYSYGTPDSGSGHDPPDGAEPSPSDAPVPSPSEPPPPPPPPSPSPPKPPELRQVLKAAKPFVGSCLGSTTGCAVCVIVLGRLPLGAVPAACTGPCFVGTFGTCGSLLGRVFSETTIICTELFRQGHLDVETYLADVAFGSMLKKESPETLKGYQFLAAPLVSSMKASSTFTTLVASFSKSWAYHMKYLVGTSSIDNSVGSWIHGLGAPICTMVGTILNYLQSQQQQETQEDTFNTTTTTENSNKNSIITTILLSTILLMFFIYLFQCRKKEETTKKIIIN